MTEVISVRFKNRGKSYFFAPGEHKIKEGQYVVVETAKGLSCGECVARNHFVEDQRVREPLQPVVRPATEADMRVLEENRKKEQEAFKICKKKIAERKLDMKLVDVEYNFEGNKILFFFTSDGRVDFRDLVKDLASVFKMRIELRQIGVRDEARMLGGLGICGKPFCCSQFLDDFQSVSIKMAKTQSLSLNPTKISGTCGRLMCCLRYEQEAYEDLVKQMPKHNAPVNTPDGPGTVADVALLRRRLKVRLENQDIKTYGLDEVGLNGAPAPEKVETPPEFTPEDELDKALQRLAGAEARDERPAPRRENQQPRRNGENDRKNEGRQGQKRSGQSRGGQNQKPRQDKQTPKKENQPRPQQPKEKDAAAAGQGSGKSRHRPRYRRRKPSGNGGNGGTGGGAPKAPQNNS